MDRGVWQATVHGKGMKQEGEEVGEQLPPQTSDPINGLAWGQAAWPQRGEVNSLAFWRLAEKPMYLL